MSLPPRSRFHLRQRFRAFTLIELLAVIAIMIIVASFLAPAVGTIIRGKQITRAANDIEGIIEMARAEAMSKNTYVWLGFKSTTINGKVVTGPNLPTNPTSFQLQVVGVRSLDGSPNFVTLDSAGKPTVVNYKPFTNMLRFDNIEMDVLANLTAEVQKIIPAATQTAVSTDLSQIADILPTNLPTNYTGGGQGFVMPPKVVINAAAGSTDIGFTNIILFTPQGEALPYDTRKNHLVVQNPAGAKVPTILVPAYTAQVFLGLRRVVNGSLIANDPDSVGIAVFGGTGESAVYRLK